MEEIWKKVRGKEEYAEISNMGQIHYYAGKSIKYPDERWTYGSENKVTGYLRASIGGVVKGVHVWVYMTFNNCDIPKGMDVNHIDENKHNNHLDNLNLMSHGDNMRYGTGIARSADTRRGKYNNAKISKAVQALDKDGNVVYEFPSTREAGRQGFDNSLVSKCCRNCFNRPGNNIYKGLIWQFKEKKFV